MNLFQNKYFYLFCISMLPIVELRGGVPAGMAFGLPFWKVYLVCVAGNLLPVPFLILFSKSVLAWLAKKKVFGGFFQRILEKADAKARSIGKYEMAGLWLFVAVPLPGTGAWTGSLVAAILRMRLLPAFLMIAAGVLTSGLVMGAVSYGLIDAIAGLFAAA